MDWLGRARPQVVCVQELKTTDAGGDRDTFQLASDRTTIVSAGEMARTGPAQVRGRYGVDPEQVPDFIALAR